MLDSLSANAHRFGNVVKTTLHRFQHALMLPTRHPPVLARRASVLERALLAVRAPVFVQFHTAFDGAESPDQFLPSGAAVFIMLRVVDEIGLIETPVGLGIRGRRLWYKHSDACIFASQNFFAFEISGCRCFGSSTGRGK